MEPFEIFMVFAELSPNLRKLVSAKQRYCGTDCGTKPDSPPEATAQNPKDEGLKSCSAALHTPFEELPYSHKHPIA